MLIAGFVFLTVSTPYRAARLSSFTDPFKDPLNTGFQSSQAIIALGAGGWHGVGLGQSVQKFLWLPAAHTDFIFAIVGEETGLLGTTAVLLGFCLFTWRGYRAGLRAPDRLGVMMAVGITTWIAVQALVNRGSPSFHQLRWHVGGHPARRGRRASQHLGPGDRPGPAEDRCDS